MKKRLLLVLSLFFLVVCLVIVYVFWDRLFTGLQHIYFQATNREKQGTSQSTIEVFSFSANSLGGKRKEMRVYLPQGYDPSSGKRYPVLYLLHGFPGSNSDWLINAQLQSELDQLISDGVLPPIMVVFPDGNGPIERDGQYLNATKFNQPMEDYLVNDVVSAIDTRYKTLAKREGRAIGGLSSGGYGAVNVGFHHSEVFSVLISHSGYFVNEEYVTRKLLGSDQEAYADNSPIDYIQAHQLQPGTEVYFDIGRDDTKKFVEQNITLDELLQQAGVNHTFVLTDGSHGWETWKKNVVGSLTYWGEILKKNPTNMN